LPLIGLNGPKNVLTFGWDVLVVAVFSLLIYALAMRVRLPDNRTHAYVGDLAAEAQAEAAELEGGAS
jgi:hypothetical protein